MLFVAALVLAVVFAYVFKAKIKKYSAVFYIAAVIISAAVAIFDFGTCPVLIKKFIELFSRGAFATAVWCLVMWTGAFKNGSALMKTFMPIRGELSIFAAILTLGHNIGYGKTYFVRIFTSPQSLKPTHLAAGIISLVMIAVMIPLTVLSVPTVRKKIPAKRWKKIQRAAYLFYALIYTHVMILFVPYAKSGKVEYCISVAVYSLVFLLYAVFRVKKAVSKKDPSVRKAVGRISEAIFVICMVVVILLMLPEKADTDDNYDDEQYTNIESDTSNDKVTFDDTETSDGADSLNTPLSDSKYKDGEYTAEAFGYDGDIKVTVEIKGDKIISIKASSNEEDLWYFEQAKDNVINSIIDSQNTDVDVVSGATYSSKGIMNAVANALKNAEN